MKLLCYLAYACVHLMLVSSRTHYFSRAPRYEKDCDWKGYVPGGRVKLTKIEAPVAKLANTATAEILGHVEETSTLAYETLNIAREASRLFAKSSPYLGPVIGIFGAVTGIISSKQTPTSDDILKAANVAIEKLTDDMNKKLADMKGYVDNSIIKSEKTSIQNQYKKSFNTLTYCLKYLTRELSTQCQRDSIKDILSSRHEFAPFASTILKSSHRLTTKQVKKLEAFLVPFRNYADLVIMGLVALMETFKHDNSYQARGLYKVYSKDLKNYAEFFVKYSKAAVKAIVDGHDSIGSCKNSFKSLKFEEVWEGLAGFKVHTTNEGRGRCLIDAFTNQRCEITGYIRADGKMPKGWDLWFLRFQGSYKDFYNPTEKEVVLDLLKGKLYQDRGKSLAEVFASKEKAVIQAYWQKQVLDSIPNWEKAIEIGKKSA